MDNNTQESEILQPWSNTLKKEEIDMYSER